MERDERDEQHGRLGRLFAALVGNEEGAPRDELARPDRHSSHLDLDALSRNLAASSDPIRMLRLFAAGVTERVGSTDAGEAPGALETYLAERLDEAGLDADGDLPAVRVVRPRTSGLFYLRIDDERISWGARQRVLRIEAALNGALLAERGIEDVDGASLEDIVCFEARCARSVVAQAATLVRGRDRAVRGEWAVRQALSEAIESARLPYRLTARFRANVAAGRAAFEIDAVPEGAWAATAYADGLGIVPATTEMRRRAASDYNLRVAVMLAAYALLVAPELCEVWVAGVEDAPDAHICRFSARLSRRLLDDVDLEGPVDPWAIMRAARATIDERDGTLAPVRQGFSLDDETLCPPARWEPVELSDAALGTRGSVELGGHVRSDLGIDEAAARRAAADELVRSLGPSTEQNVRTLLDASGAPASPDVREAALRCVGELISGELADDPLAICDALVSGSGLERDAAAAGEAFRAHNLEGAERLARQALEAVDERLAGAGDGVAWRAFETYADRVLYNRLVAPAGEACRLLPHAYPEACLIASACALARGDVGRALEDAHRAREVEPLSTQASLHLAQCLEAAGDATGATEETRRLLSLAHDGETIGVGYLRMAQLQWQAGNVLAAQACYQLACARLGAPMLVAGLAVVALIGHVGEASETSLDADQVSRALSSQDIPLAPTEEVGAVLMGASAAAVDAGMFGVARDVTRSLCMVLRDDVLFGVLRSLEGEPDR